MLGDPVAACEVGDDCGIDAVSDGEVKGVEGLEVGGAS
jgi:hypothetical protein